MTEKSRDISVEEFNFFSDVIKSRIISIQSKHQSWFDNRAKGKVGIGPNLTDHYTFHIEGDTYVFAFAPGSDLPEEIKSMCYITYLETLDSVNRIIR